MDNGSLPAMPVKHNDLFNEFLDGYRGGKSFGLTKREYIAVMAMQGLLSSDTDNDWEYNAVARSAVAHADALLAALEADNG